MNSEFVTHSNRPIVSVVTVVVKDVVALDDKLVVAVLLDVLVTVDESVVVSVVDSVDV